MPPRPLFPGAGGFVPTPVVQYESGFAEYVDHDEGVLGGVGALQDPYEGAGHALLPLPAYEDVASVDAHPQGYARGALAEQPYSPHERQLMQVPWLDGRTPYLASASDTKLDSPRPSDDDPNHALLGLLGAYAGSEAHGTPAADWDEPQVASYSDEADAMARRVHYGHIPQKQPRRTNTVRRVKLSGGHLVLDCPVPPKLLARLPITDGREFTHMRYTAVTCAPDDFAREGYMLRSALYAPVRETELCIVLTMYNEDEKLFTRTMHGVMQNIAYLCRLKNSRVWGPDGWKRIVVCIVADGRAKVSSRTLSVLATMGVYQEGVAKTQVQGVPVEAHLYEYTAQISVDTAMKFRSQERGLVPVQIVFCMKEHNRKKINSHRWCFNAFGPVLQPSIYVLLDVGTKPRARSIYRLWNEFARDPQVGGACGEIVALKGRFWSLLWNPLVAAQNFEYKLSNVLDKPMESVFGYIGVLPGAFSAYRYEALLNDEMGHGPLASYFKGETLHGGESDADVFTSNMYLAEDRILCWELVTKRKSSWLLRYVKRAQAETDVPGQVPELIAQRRRWLNGSLFAAIHAATKVGYIHRSSHSAARKVALHIEMVYQLVQLLFAWFSMANYFIAFCILTQAMADDVPRLHIPVVICQYVYIICLLFCYLLAMGNRPAGSMLGYVLSMVVFGVLMVVMMAAVVYLSYMGVSHAVADGPHAAFLHNPEFVRVFIAVLSTYGVWFFASLLFLEPWHMVTCVLQYLLLSPSFINVISIYAFCNTHDVSWGTKGYDSRLADLGAATSADTANAVEVSLPTEPHDMDAAYEDACHVLSTKPDTARPQIDAETRKKDYYAMVRTNVVLAWTLTNGALAVAIINLPRAVHSAYMAFLFYSVAVLACFRLLGAIVYQLSRCTS